MNDSDDPGTSKPSRTQFKPGTSGNRRGRPQSSKNKRTILKQILFSTVPVRQGGRVRHLRAIDVMHQQLIHKAVAGDRRAMKMVMKWSDVTGSLPRFEPPGRYLSGAVRYSEFLAATGIDPESEEFMDMYIASQRGRPPRARRSDP